MRPEEREFLRKLFQFRCGYCGVRERDVGAELTVDHFQPRSKGGMDEPANWVYSCHACNEFKSDYWQPDSPTRILNPLREDLALHMVEGTDARLRGLTETGAFHIDRLHLNRQQLVEFRRDHQRMQADGLEKARRLARILELEELVKKLSEELGITDRGDTDA